MIYYKVSWSPAHKFDAQSLSVSTKTHRLHKRPYTAFVSFLKSFPVHTNDRCYLSLRIRVARVAQSEFFKRAADTVIPCIARTYCFRYVNCSTVTHIHHRRWIWLLGLTSLWVSRAHCNLLRLLVIPDLNTLRDAKWGCFVTFNLSNGETATLPGMSLFERITGARIGRFYALKRSFV